MQPRKGGAEQGRHTQGLRAVGATSRRVRSSRQAAEAAALPTVLCFTGTAKPLCSGPVRVFARPSTTLL